MLIILFLLSQIRPYLYKIAINYLLSPFSYAIYSFIYDLFFWLFVFPLYNDVYFEHTENYKKDANQRTHILYIRIGFPKKTVNI